MTYLDRLRDVALDQYGYVTSAHALSEGVPRTELSKMVHRGRLDRVAHGVYQVPQVISGRYAPYMLAVLWTGAPEACLSHETALQAWEISDINPDHIDVTVAKNRRIKRQGRQGYIIHHHNLAPEQVTWWEQIRITNAPTTIADCIEWGVPTYLIKQALERTAGTSMVLTNETNETGSQPNSRNAIMENGEPFNLSAALSTLPPKTKTPNSAHVLDNWITLAESKLGGTKGRLGWLIASTVVAAVLQQAVDEQGQPLLLLKGGTLLQHRLPGSRATTDLDGLVRGDIDVFLADLDQVLRHPWGPLTFRRDTVETIEVPGKLIKPCRFDVIAMLNGVTWRRIQVEVSPDEGDAGLVGEPVAAPALSVVGLPNPDHLLGLSMRYQIAQKVHAATDPHDPPDYVNDRARDVVDLLLLH